jgi:ribonuclease J
VNATTRARPSTPSPTGPTSETHNKQSGNRKQREQAQTTRTSRAAAPVGLPKRDPEAMRVIPLGGVGEIGRNMTVFDYGDTILIIDAGVLFPDENQHGVDLILPDMSYLRDNRERISGLVLTHGHEDHIGAVPYVLRERGDIPVYGTALTLALVQKKLDEHNMKADLHTIHAGQKTRIGGFGVEFVTVNHSIPDAVAISLTTAAGTVLHTGDFKMDQFPLDSKLTDLRSFARLGHAGVDLFLTDSTNADVPGFTMSEKDLKPAIDNVFATTPGRVIVSTFASHIHRVQNIVDAAVKSGRKIVFQGRSMVRNMDVAQELNYLHVPAGTIVSLHQAASLPEHQIAIICTGSQGEMLAALARMSHGTHRIEVEPGDTVLLASSAVPGNESAISTMIDRFVTRGVNVVHKGTAKVHTSGHASAGELAYCYNIVQPTHVMPVHGEPRHLQANANIATATGVPVDKVLIGKDGTVVDLTDGVARIVGAIDAPHVFVENSMAASTDTLTDRQTLAADGVVTVVAIVDRDSGALDEHVDLIIRGLTTTAGHRTMLSDRLTAAFNTATGSSGRSRSDDEKLVTDAVSVWAAKVYRRSPLIIPVIVDA